MNKTHGFRQFLFFYRKAGTRINEELILFNDAFGLVPVSKTFPIIGTDNEIKFPVGIRFMKFLQCIYAIRSDGANEIQSLKLENEDNH